MNNLLAITQEVGIKVFSGHVQESYDGRREKDASGDRVTRKGIREGPYCLGNGMEP